MKDDLAMTPLLVGLEAHDRYALLLGEFDELVQRDLCRVIGQQCRVAITGFGELLRSPPKPARLVFGLPRPRRCT